LSYPTWQDHITNIEVRERTGVPAVSETISQRRLSMLGHMSRMPPSADAYKAIYQDIPSDWRRRPGRTRQLAGYHTPRSAATRYWPGQCSWTCRLLWRGLIRGATRHFGACYWWWWWWSLKVPTSFSAKSVCSIFNAIIY